MFLYRFIQVEMRWGFPQTHNSMSYIATGIISAIKLRCLDGGRRFKKWKENKNGMELIDYYSKKRLARKRSDIYVITHGHNIIRGTYVFNELILSIALWISPDFYDKVYTIVRDYYEVRNRRMKTKGRIVFTRHCPIYPRTDEQQNETNLQQIYNKFTTTQSYNIVRKTKPLTSRILAVFIACQIVGYADLVVITF